MCLPTGRELYKLILVSLVASHVVWGWETNCHYVASTMDIRILNRCLVSRWVATLYIDLKLSQVLPQVMASFVISNGWMVYSYLLWYVIWLSCRFKTFQFYFPSSAAFSILGCHTLCGNAVSFYMATNNGILIYEGPCNNISSGR